MPSLLLFGTVPRNLFIICFSNNKDRHRGLIYDGMMAKVLGFFVGKYIPISYVKKHRNYINIFTRLYNVNSH